MKRRIEVIAEIKDKVLIGLCRYLSLKTRDAWIAYRISMVHFAWANADKEVYSYRMIPINLFERIRLMINCDICP